MTADWFRSIVVLGAAVIVVVGMTFGLAALIVPGAGVARAPDATPGASGGAGVPGSPPPLADGAGAVIVAAGDLTGHMVLSREDTNDRYALAGDDGRVILEGSPPVVAQISFDGWEFFPDPDECTVTPGEGDVETGLATATLECVDLAEVRDKGTVSLTGEMRLAADVVGLAPDLPDSGGIADVGDERWEFAEAYLLAFALPAIADDVQYNLVLAAEDPLTALNFTYDDHTHAIALASVEREGVRLAVPPDACELTVTELGRFNPRASAAYLTAQCASVEVQGLGTVPISVDIVVHQLEAPES